MIYDPEVLRTLPEAKREGGRVEIFLKLYEPPATNPTTFESSAPKTSPEGGVEALQVFGVQGVSSLFEEETITPKTKTPPQTPNPSRGKLWRFLAPPEKFQFSGRSANYASISPLLSSEPLQQYTHTSAEKLKIQDLLLDTWCEGKSVRPLLEGVEALLKISEPSKFEPPTLSLVFGKSRFEPCKLLSATRNEYRWLDGEPAGVRLSLSFIRLVEPSRGSGESPLLGLEDPTAEDLNLELTEREMAEAMEAAETYLEENPQRYDPKVRELLASGDWEAQVSSNGELKLMDSEQKEVGVIGGWEDGEITIQGIETLPLAEGTGKPEPGVDD
mgnify:CR=1 FL=1